MEHTHLFTFESELDESSRNELKNTVSGLNFSELNRYFNRAQEQSKSATALIPEKLAPIDENMTNINSTAEQSGKWKQIGLDNVKNGKVGVLLLAGGQGTRLGMPLPKGCLSIKSLSNKSLFQLQFERIQKVESMAGGKIPLYIMTSPATYDATTSFLSQNKFFGLDESQVKVFNQGLLPCFAHSGEILLGTKFSLATAPDGNGGLWKAVRSSGSLDDMQKRGLKQVHMYCVDNCLTNVADPEFLGFAWEKESDCGAKCVLKSEPHEPVGVVCKYEGLPRVVEYSEISTELAEKRREDGGLTYNAANICNHYFTVDFIDKVSSPEWEDKLIHHVASKKIPTVDLKTGESIKPTTPNGIKLEKFVFDVFQFSERFCLFNMPREKEFAPLKNADTAKSDNMRCARSKLHRLHHSWVLNAGGKFKNEAANQLGKSDFAETEYEFQVEIAANKSFMGEGLDFQGQVFDLPLFLE